MNEQKYRAYHRLFGMIDESEYFTIADAVEGDLFFFGSPSKDYDIDDFIFMQCTGLRDKTGKDIYKEDIVRYTLPSEYGLPATEHIVTIAWGEECMGFNLGHMSHHLTISDDVEVIGNTYETPELRTGL